MFRGFAADPDRAARRAGVASIGEQVDQHLGQALRVSLDPVRRIAEVEELYFDATPVQRQQSDGLLGDFAQAHRFQGLQVAAGVGEAHQRLDDARYALGLVEDLLADFGQLAIAFAFLAQVLRQAGDAGDRIADLVGHPGGKAADGSQALGVDQLVFQQLGFGEVFHQ